MAVQCKFWWRKANSMRDVAEVAADRKLALAVFPLSITDTGSIPAQNPGNVSFVKLDGSSGVHSRVVVGLFGARRARETSRILRAVLGDSFRRDSVKRACLGTIGDVPDAKNIQRRQEAADQRRRQPLQRLRLGLRQPRRAERRNGSRTVGESEGQREEKENRRARTGNEDEDGKLRRRTKGAPPPRDFEYERGRNCQRSDPRGARRTNVSARLHGENRCIRVAYEVATATISLSVDPVRSRLFHGGGYAARTRLNDHGPRHVQHRDRLQHKYQEDGR